MTETLDAALASGARSSSRVQRRDVLVVGGGIAGIEALMALADLGDNRLRLRLVAPRASFGVPRDALGVPWGAPLVEVDLERLCRAFGALSTIATVTGVDADLHEAHVEGGATIAFERLLLAPGARPHLAYPGTPSLGFGALPHQLATDGAASVAIVVPDGVSWTLPAYQLALMTAAEGRDVRVVTAEDHALAAFGAGTRTAVRDLLARHDVVVETGAAPRPGASVGDLADLVVSLPLLRGVGIAGLPTDADGFVHVDAHGAVLGLADVWAAGDAGDHTMKQGGLAAQQAESAAVEIVRSCGGEIPRRSHAPVLSGLLAAGGEELFLRRTLDGLDPGRASAEALWEPPAAICAPRLARWLEVHRHELDHSDSARTTPPTGGNGP